jgi:predicted enzyme related to lactoylglutathione lyase
MTVMVVQWDIHARDAIAQRRFFSSIFGWRCSHPETRDEYGWMFTADGGMIGGIGQAGPDESPGVAIFVQVPDVATTMRRAKELGGGVYWGPVNAKSDMVTGCISDPERHGVLLIQPSSQGEPYASCSPVDSSTWTWDIQSRNPDGLAPFYTDLFGWTWLGLQERGWGPLETGPDGGVAGGITRSNDDQVVIAIHVDDLLETGAAFEQHGGSILAPPHQVSSTLSIATCLDPEGNQIGLYNLTPAGSSSENASTTAHSM